MANSKYAENESIGRYGRSGTHCVRLVHFSIHSGVYTGPHLICSPSSPRHSFITIGMVVTLECSLLHRRHVCCFLVG